MFKKRELESKIEGLQKDVSFIKYKMTSRAIAITNTMKPIGRVIQLSDGRWFKATSMATRYSFPYGTPQTDWENYDGVVLSNYKAKISVDEIAESVPADPDSLAAALFAAYDKYMKAGEDKRKTK